MLYWVFAIHKSDIYEVSNIILRDLNALHLDYKYNKNPSAQKGMNKVRDMECHR